MAWTPKVWVDRSVQNPKGRKLTNQTTGEITYVDVERFEGTLFAEGDKPDATNLNAEFNKIKAETDALGESVSALAETTLWTNSNPTSSFAGQTVTLSESIDNFSYYEVEFIHDTLTGNNYHYRTGKISKSNQTRMQIADAETYIRYISSVPSGTSFSFGNGLRYASYGGSPTTYNTAVIPYRIFGYK